MAKKKASAKKKRKATSRKKAFVNRFEHIKADALADIGEPVGACFFVDETGQNQCRLMTQSECTKQPSSTFFPNKQCPGGF